MSAFGFPSEISWADDMTDEQFLAIVHNVRGILIRERRLQEPNFDESDLGRLILTRNGPAHELDIENLGSSAIDAGDIRDQVRSVIRDINDLNASVQTGEPNEWEQLEGPTWPEPGEPGEADEQIINSHIHAFDVVQRQALVSVSDLSVDDRICCICGMEFVDTTTAEIQAEVDSQIIDENREERCAPIRLQCGHIVGDKCICRWVIDCLRRELNAHCPICRRIILDVNN